MTFADSKLTSFAAVAVLCGALCSTAAGQSRNRRDRDFEFTQPRSTVNSAHEKLKEQAKQAYAQHKYERVVELMNTVLREDPRDHFAYYYRASARAELGLAAGDAKLTRQAVADARQAINLDRAKTTTYYLPYLYGMANLTMIEKRRDHAATAVKVAGQVLGLSRLTSIDRANFYYQRGYAYRAMGKLDEAENDFQAAIRSSRVHLAAHLAAAEAYAAAGKTTEAKAQYDLAVSTFSDNPMVFNRRGVYLQSLGKFREAMADFNKVISLDGKSAMGYLNRGFCSLGMGDAKAAEADFTKSLELDGSQPLAFTMRARARMAQANLAGATSDNFTAVQLNPKDADAHAQLAFCQFFSGKNDDAAKSFGEAVKLNAGMQYLAPWRFLAMERAGHRDEALKLFAKELAKSAESRNWVDNLLAFLAGKIDAKALLAAVDQKETDKKLGQTCEAHFFIGSRLQAAGEFGAARQHFREALESKQRHLSSYGGAEFALKKLAAPPSREEKK